MQFIKTIIPLFLSLIITTCYSQNLNVEGTMIVGNSMNNAPEPGTIRWTGFDLEGWNGLIWVSLTDYTLGSIEDIDGNIYKTIKIGNNTWMAENLKTTRLNDGIAMGDNTLNAGWEGANFPSRCRYDNSDSVIDPYGYLYNGYAVEDGRLCPSGWHVSTVAEWDALIDLFGGEAIAGGPLKESGTAHWAGTNTGATNQSGFGAIPGGNRKPDGSYINLTQYGNYWAVDLVGLPLKDYNFEYNNVDATQITITDRRWGLSVRCVKNE